MGSYNTAVITTVGQALLTSVLGAQGTMTFTKLQTSSYAYASGTDLSALTSLNNVEQEANVGSATIVDSTHIAADATISNSGISTEYNANTLGIFASDGVNEVLFAVSTAVTPDVIPADQGGTPSTYKYNFTLAVSSTSDITISAVGNIDASDVAYDNSVSGLSASNVQAAIDEIVSSVKRAGKITLSAVSVELTNAAPTATVSFTTNSDGVASVASSDPTIATASLSGTVVTITGLKSGTPTVTISIPETEHYTACSAAIAVTSTLFTVGETYKLGSGAHTSGTADLECVVLDIIGTNAICQSKGIYGAAWPGISELTSVKSTYFGDLASAVSGLYLPRGNADGSAMATAPTEIYIYNGSSFVNTYNTSAKNTIIEAARQYAEFGVTVGQVASLGTPKDASLCWGFVNGNISDMNSAFSTVIAPSFILDLTKVKLHGDLIVDINAADPPTKVSFASATPAQREAIVRAYEAGIIDITEYWTDGEEATATLPAIAASGTGWTVGESHASQEVTLVLSLDNCKELVTIGVNGQKNTKFLYHQKNCLEEAGYMNSTATNTGSWESSARRGWCNNGYKAAMIQAFGDIFHELKNVTAQTYNGSTNQTSNDYFAIPAEKEVQGSRTHSNETEANALIQMEYYKIASNKLKNAGNSGADTSWWNRSPYYGNNSYYVLTNNGTSGLADANVGYYGQVQTKFAPFGGV